MEQWIIDMAFKEFGFEEALDVCFAAASYEVENMIDSKIEHYKMFDCIKLGFVPVDASIQYRVIFSKKL